VTGPSGEVTGPEDPQAAGPEDVQAVTASLGRPPAGRFTVVVRDERGAPAVIANDAFLADGTPMPTRFWLVDPVLHDAVSRLESAGGVRQAERDVDPERLAEAHVRYAADRDRSIPAGHPGPRPSGGVGGTRRGVKCLHAHLAWWMVGGDDPVGAWTAVRLGLHGGAPTPDGRASEGR
jgi:hypothetical protein